jgi:hypothetical protein
MPGGAAAADDIATIDAVGASYTVAVGDAGATSIGSINLNASGATLGVSGQGLTVKTALNLNSGRLLLQGTLSGGSLVMNGGVVMRNASAALDGVRVQGTLDLSTPYRYGLLTLSNYGQLTLMNNTTFVGADGTSPGLIRISGSALTFGTSAQFDNASINFAAGHTTASSLNIGTAADAIGKTVAFGAHAVLDVAADVAVTLGGSGTLVNGGAINVAGTLTVDPLAQLVQATQPGTLTIFSGGTLIFSGSTAYNGAITFKDPTAQLVFQGDGAVAATLQDFQNGDSVDLQSLVYSAGLALSVQDGAVHISQGGLVMADFKLTGNPAAYSVDQFSLAADASGGTLLQTTHSVKADPDFDAAYYLAKNPDVAAGRLDPLQHYLQYGWKEGRDPSAYFNTNWYRSQNPDIAAGLNPLTHFETVGWQQGRDPGPNFSVSAYLAAYPDVKAAGTDPLQQFLSTGLVQGRSASPAVPHAVVVQDPLIDRAYYLAHNPDVAAAGLDPQQQYFATGWKEGRNPDAFFDTNYYLAHNADVKAAGINPLLHFEQYGWKEGRDPSALFSDAKYLAANPDVKAVGVNPLAHYLAFGQFEGRMTFLSGVPAAAADPLVDAAYYDKQIGLTPVPPGVAGQQQAAASYDATGWQKGLNPNAFFDTNYYLSHNADVVAAHINPLLHYEQYGWHEGRDPSAAFSSNKYLAAYSDVKAAALDPLLHYVQYGQGEGRTAFAV